MDLPVNAHFDAHFDAADTPMKRLRLVLVLIASDGSTEPLENPRLGLVSSIEKGAGGTVVRETKKKGFSLEGTKK